MKDFAREIKEYGLTAKLKSDSQPGISELVEVEGPGGNGGNRSQFYSKMSAPAPGFKRTGVAPLRLGHVAVISEEADKLMKFCEDFLGFWRTDDIADLAYFYTCNRDHHVVNIVNAPLSKVHHIAFQLKDNAHQAVAGDALRERGVKTLTHPLIQAGPKVCVKTLFWFRNSSYFSTSGLKRCSGMLGMRS